MKNPVRRSASALLLGAVLLAGAPPVEALQDAPPPPVRGEITISEEGLGHLTLIYAEAGSEPDTLVTLARAQRGDEGVRSGADGGVELRFAPRPLPEVIPPLRLARELLGEGELPVSVRIPGELRSGDVWEFQALLAQAGIRRVRIVAGDPSPER